jgi:hypothetical protein
MTEPAAPAAAPARVRSLLSTLPAPSSKDERDGRVARLAVATVGSLVAAGVMRSWEDSPPLGLWVPAGLLALAALLAHHGAVGSQLIARSVWWANLVLGTLISVVGSGHETPLGVVLALSSGAALLAMGRMGLDEDERSAFRPVAFRTTLTLGMIMAVADAQELLLFGALRLEDRSDLRLEQGGLLLGSAAFIMLAIAGLYRLRVWGLLLSSVGAIGVFALAASDAYGMKGALANTLMLTSVVQLLLPAPIFVAIARRRAPEPGVAASRLARLVPTLLVASMMAASVLMVCAGRHR